MFRIDPKRPLLALASTAWLLAATAAWFGLTEHEGAVLLGAAQHQANGIIAVLIGL